MKASKRVQPRYAPGKARGFVLIMVIGMLVVLLILASVAAVTVNRVRVDQLREDEQSRGLLGMQSTRATLLYLLATQRMTFGGLTVDDQMRLSADEKEMQTEGEAPISNMPVGNEIRLDDSLYEGLDGSELAIQDDRGRINVNWSNQVVLQRWLDRLGVPAEQRGALYASLLDYQDPDDLYRINGAEALQYQEKRLPPPPNRPLISPQELRNVMGWGKVLAPLDSLQLLDQVSVSRDGQVSVNSAPVDVLDLLPGVSRAMAERVVALRNVQPISDEATLYALLPTVPPENDFVSLHPGLSGTLALWPKPGAAGWLTHWTLTPFDDGGRPWRIDYEIRFPARSGLGTAPARKAATPLLPHSATPNT